MFEQAVLANGPAGKRAWTTFLGLTSQLVLVSLAVLAPMVFPQVLPLARFDISLAPPQAPPPRDLGDEMKPARMHTAATKRPFWSMNPVQPTFVPKGVVRFVDPPPDGLVPGAIVGDSVGPVSDVISSIMQGFGDEAARVNMLRPVIPEKPAQKPVTEVVLQRLVQGGNVHLGALLHKVEPPYPQIAKAARVSGDVVLECVVGPDGRIHEVKVKSGNALLVRAAVDAAWQWAYAPSQLNGVPIEIVTILTFNFKLN